MGNNNRYQAIKSLAGQPGVNPGVPLLDEQAVFQPTPETPNDKLVNDLGRNLVMGQRRVAELETAVTEAWTMREILAVQILASQGAIVGNQEGQSRQTEQYRKGGSGQPRPKDWKEGISSGRYWSESEHLRFLEGIVKYGVKNVREIAQAVGSRNATQVRTHLQKYMLRRDEWDRRFQPRQEIVADLDRMLQELQSMNESAKRQKDAQMEAIMGRNAGAIRQHPLENNAVNNHSQALVQPSDTNASNSAVATHPTQKETSHAKQENGLPAGSVNGHNPHSTQRDS